MCQRLYIASQQALPLLKKTKREPYLEVGELEDAEAGIRRNFRKEFTHVYVAGAHVPCGCGFPELALSKNGAPRKISEEDMRTMQRLCEYLRPALGKRPQVQLYLCRWGDHDERPQQEREVRLGELAAPSFRFRRMEILSVRRGEAETNAVGDAKPRRP